MLAVKRANFCFCMKYFVVCSSICINSSRFSNNKYNSNSVTKENRAFKSSPHLLKMYDHYSATNISYAVESEYKRVMAKTYVAEYCF